MATAERCPICGQQVPVRADGTVVPHKAEKKYQYGRKGKYVGDCEANDKKVGDL